jgi:sugar phosphate permease
MPSKSLRWTIWILAALFYFYEYLLRISPGIILVDLMKKFAINASQVGFLSALFLYAYAPMQLPVGLLMDRFGLKIILSVAACVCGIGTYFFASSDHLTAAAFGRILIGAASAFGFISMLYVSTHFFSERKRAFMVGLANSISMLGASSGAGPFASLISDFGWEKTLKIFSLFGILLGGIIYFTLRNDREKTHLGDSTTYPLKNIIGSKLLWINSLIALLFYMTTTGFGGLWGPTYLQNVKGYSREVASYGISLIFIGWMIGGPLVGMISDFFQKRTNVVFFGILGCLASISLVIYLQLPVMITYTLLFLVGVFSSAQLLNFTLSIEMSSLKAKATAVAFTNFIVSCGDGFIQPFIGYLLDKNWTGKIQDGVRVYSASSYQLSMSTLPVALALALFLLYILNNLLSKKRPKSV